MRYLVNDKFYEMNKAEADLVHYSVEPGFLIPNYLTAISRGPSVQPCTEPHQSYVPEITLHIQAFDCIDLKY